MTGLFSFVASEPEKAVFVSDPKDGELAAQAIPMLHAMGRKVALIDDFGVRPELAAYRIELNAFGSTASAYLRDPSLLIYVNEMVSHSLIEEPPDQDMRNFYYRHSPRTLIEFANSVSLKRDPNLAAPGAVAALVSDLDMLTTYAEIEAEEGDPALKAAARGVLEMRNHEHFQQHVGEAARALRHFGPGTKLQDAGRDAQISHEDLIREGYVVFLAGPQALMSKLGSYYALHTGGFVQAIYRNIGPLRIIGDEFTNSPLKLMIEAISTVRAFGGEYHLIAQSHSEVLRKYGEHLTQTVEDNSITKQWIGGLGSFTEADRISKAMGDQHALATALSGENGSIKTNTNLSLIKQRHMTAAELMSLPADQAVCHVKGVGFFVHRTLSQANLAPFCSEITENPLEGGRLPPDPKITLTTPGAAT
ncbi:MULTISPECIES: TraM recognition domain-containing protein [Alphaproteobacteria]|uniref:type IV secretory system conjugative DNA transfer family protein n=1 Tax=Alphaproteobacteria TaxID=28211 RepID=UPI003299AAF6